MTERQQIAALLDHSVLRPESTQRDVEEGCRVALTYQTASLCVRSSDLPQAVSLLKDSPVALCSVIGFPHGSASTFAKMAEAENALRNGAVELDVVLHIGQLLSGNLSLVSGEISALTELTHHAGAKIKIIFETCFLQKSHIEDACRICNDAAVDWVKTSTGFGTRGATVADVQLMRRLSLPPIQVKASGGIRDLPAVLQYRDLGCTRIGTSSTVSIMASLP